MFFGTPTFYVYHVLPMLFVYMRIVVLPDLAEQLLYFQHLQSRGRRNHRFGCWFFVFSRCGLCCCCFLKLPTGDLKCELERGSGLFLKHDNL